MSCFLCGCDFGLTKCNRYIPPAQLKKTVDETFARIDTNGDGKLDFSEFVQAVTQSQIEIVTKIGFV
jgi:hypothetical protein